jgi:hypothetical protein
MQTSRVLRVSVVFVTEKDCKAPTQAQDENEGGEPE